MGLINHTMLTKEPSSRVLGSDLPAPAGGVVESRGGWATGPSKPRMAPESPALGFSSPPAWNTKLAGGCMSYTFSRSLHPLESPPPSVGAPAAHCWESLLSGVPTA